MYKETRTFDPLLFIVIEGSAVPQDKLHCRVPKDTVSSVDRRSRRSAARFFLDEPGRRLCKIKPKLFSSNYWTQFLDLLRGSQTEYVAKGPKYAKKKRIKCASDRRPPFLQADAPPQRRFWFICCQRLLSITNCNNVCTEECQRRRKNRFGSAEIIFSIWTRTRREHRTKTYILLLRKREGTRLSDTLFSVYGDSVDNDARSIYIVGNDDNDDNDEDNDNDKDNVERRMCHF